MLHTNSGPKAGTQGRLIVPQERRCSTSMQRCRTVAKAFRACPSALELKGASSAEGRRSWKRSAVPLRPHRSPSQKRREGVRWGRCVMGKSAAEPHTFSQFFNFLARGTEIKLWCRYGERVSACTVACLRTSRQRQAAGLPGQVGRGQAGGQVAPGRRARALALPLQPSQPLPRGVRAVMFFPPSHF